MKKRLLSLALSLALILPMLPVTSRAAEVDSGICGDNLTWSLDNSGTLTISGTGPMTDYAYNSAPWYAHKDNINHIVIENNVETIGENAFHACANLTDLALGTGLKTIGDSAFYTCDKLTSIVIPDGVIEIGVHTFLCVTACLPQPFPVV